MEDGGGGWGVNLLGRIVNSESSSTKTTTSKLLRQKQGLRFVGE